MLTILRECDRDDTVWDAETGNLVSEPVQCFYPCALSPDGKYIASTLGVGLIQILDTQTNLISGSLEHQHETRSIAMSFDGKYIVFGDRDRMIRVRDAILFQGRSKGTVTRSHPTIG